MSNRAIIYGAVATAAIVGFLVFRGTVNHGGNGTATALLNGLGILTPEQKTTIDTHAQTRSGRGHF